MKGKEEEHLMNRVHLLPLIAVFLFSGLHPSKAFAMPEAGESTCSEYSDSFESYNLERWQDVLLYSRQSGTVGVKDGLLNLRCPKDDPCEIQIYSLFTFEGDFDVQADFTVPVAPEACQFNAGLVIQTLGDEKSYKCYIAGAPGRGLFYRARMDYFGEQNQEKLKGGPSPQTGTLRVVRKAGRLTFLVLDSGAWQETCTFAEPCNEKVRVRFKLQTGDDEKGTQSCPVAVMFDNFAVNACDTIGRE